VGACDYFVFNTWLFLPGWFDDVFQAVNHIRRSTVAEFHNFSIGVAFHELECDFYTCFESFYVGPEDVDGALGELV